jgi:hypothetical protein
MTDWSLMFQGWVLGIVTACLFITIKEYFND